MFLSKAAETDAHPVKLIDVDTQNAPKIKATKGASWRRSGAAITFNKEDLSTQKIVRQKRRTGDVLNQVELEALDVSFSF